LNYSVALVDKIKGVASY